MPHITVGRENSGDVVTLPAQPQPHLAGAETGDEPVVVPLSGDHLDQLSVAQCTTARPA